MNVPEQFQGSVALQFVTSQGWNWKVSTAPNIELERCPYCGKDNYGHLYMEVHGTADEQRKRDGLHTCHRCGKGGSLYSLKEHLGVVIPGVQSRKDWAGSEREIEPLPNVEEAHEALLADEDAMDYLMNHRGFSRDIIERQKLGLKRRYFRETGEVRALLYPYLVNGNCVFVHYRTLPTMPVSENKVPKSFNSPKGWDAPLYNQEVLQAGIKDVILVEGEANTIAGIDHGIQTICGVPGANFKKADWIETLDKLELDRIYICYDSDRVGQKAAQTLASRIGVEKCWRITLPSFEFTDPETGLQKKGKDLNEWFVHGGGSAGEFERLKAEAAQFDVDGVAGTQDALDELEDELRGREGVEPMYKPPWKSLAKLVGFDPGDVIDIIAAEKIGKTTFALNLVEHMVNTYDEDCVFICLEMMRTKLARKWVCHVTGLADNLPKTDEEAKALKESFLKAIPEAKNLAASRKGDLYWCYPRYKKVDDIYKLMIDCIRRYGVKWIVIDNIQRLCDTTLGSKNRTQHLSEISKTTSQIAKDYGVKVIRILQPHRVKDGQLVSTDNNDGASQIGKDCDSGISLNRNRVAKLTAQQFQTMAYVENNETFDDKMLASVDLSRYSAGGQTTLHYNGATSTVSEYNMAQIAKINAEAQKDVGYAGQLAALGIPTDVPGDIRL